MAVAHETDHITLDELAKPVLRPPNEEISFTELFSIVFVRRWSVIVPVLVTAAVATAVAFLIPPEFTAEAVILTPQQAQPSLTAMAQLAGVSTGAGLSGLSLLSGFGLRNPSDLYVGILESRTIADTLIKKFDLERVYSDEDYQRARKHLAQHTAIRSGKDTLIHVKVEDQSPKRAAQLANAYVEELSLRNSTVALTEASQRRLFFENQLVKEKNLLAAAEIALRDIQQFTGLVVPTGQAEALIRSASQLHAEILSRQAQLAGMKTYAADDNPRLQAVKRELGALQTELTALEQGEHVAGNPELPVGKLPQAALEYIRKYRDMKYHETLYEALSKQYEAARLDEAKSAPLVQVIDSAVEPERKSWPPRALIVFGASGLAAVISIMLIVSRISGSRQKL